MAIMSDSSIGLKPVIEDPSKPIPPSKASSSSDGVDREALELTEHVREPQADEADVLSLTILRTSAAFSGRSAMVFSVGRFGARNSTLSRLQAAPNFAITYAT